MTFYWVPLLSPGLHLVLLSPLFWASGVSDAAGEALELVQVLYSCGYAWLCKAVLVLCNAMLWLCKCCVRLCMVQTKGCVESGLWLCRIWTVAVLEFPVGPRVGLCGSIQGSMWVHVWYSLVWVCLDLAESNRYFEVFWASYIREKGLEAYSCLPVEVLHVITQLSRNIHRCLTHVWQWVFTFKQRYHSQGPTLYYSQSAQLMLNCNHIEINLSLTTLWRGFKMAACSIRSKTLGEGHNYGLCYDFRPFFWLFRLLSLLSHLGLLSNGKVPSAHWQ